MNTKEFLESVKIIDKVKKQKQKLKNPDKSTWVNPLIKEEIKLSKEDLNILNVLFSINKDLSFYGNFSKIIIKKHSTDFEILKPVFENQNYKNKKYKNIFLFFFGSDLYEDIMVMLDEIINFPYQFDEYKRSFRFKEENNIIIAKKIKAVLILNDTLIYDIPFTDYLKYIDITDGIYYTYFMPNLFQAKIKNGNTDILKQMIDVAYNRHETIKINSPIIKTLLLSNDPEAFKAIEDLLLAAQRSEGLRQSILECLDQTTIPAQKHFMKVIIDNKLTRFSSVIRALDVWCGLGFDAEKEPLVIRLMTMGLHFLEHPEEVSKAMKSMDNTEVYMALWAAATIDVNNCKVLLKDLIKRPELEKRMLAIYFARETRLNEEMEEICLLGLADKNIEVFALSLDLIYIGRFERVELQIPYDKKLFYFNTIENRVLEVPEKGILLQGKIFNWDYFDIKREHFYNKMIQLLFNEDDEFFKRMFVYFKKMPSDSRASLVRSSLRDFGGYGYQSLKDEQKHVEPTKCQRDYAFLAITDNNSYSREYATGTIEKITPTKEERIEIEYLLKTNNNTFRKSLVELLCRNSIDDVKASIERLLARKQSQYKMAGLSMLNHLKMNDMETKWVSEKAEEYKKNNAVSAEQEIILNNLLENTTGSNSYTAKNGYGLYNPKNISIVKKPEKPNIPEDYFHLSVKYSKFCEELEKLHKIYVENKDYEYEATNKYVKEKQKHLLGNTFTTIVPEDNLKTNEEKAANYPLIETWRTWFKESKLVPKDLFVFTLMLQMHDQDDVKIKSLDKQIKKLFDFNGFKDIEHLFKRPVYYLDSPFVILIKSLQLSFPFDEKVKFMENLFKTICSEIDEETLAFNNKKDKDKYIDYWFQCAPVSYIYSAYNRLTEEYNDETFTEFWKITAFMISTIPPQTDELLKFRIASIDDILRAFKMNLITEDELICALLDHNKLYIVSKKPTYYYGALMHLDRYDFLDTYLDRISKGILEVELKRGDASTPVSHLAGRLHYVKGMETYAKILVALGKSDLFSGYDFSDTKNKKQILSFFLDNCKKLENETQADFDRIVNEYNISRTKLIESAIYSTKWAPFVASHLKIPELESAVWWIHAHTNGANNKTNVSEITKYSKVDITDFSAGAVDVDWFNSLYKALGEETWNEIYKYGKYSSLGNGHTRAKLYADAILGKVDKDETWVEIIDKRNPDKLRAYGVIPLPKNAKKREKEILERYRNIEEFKKGSKQFGAQRRETEKNAATIALDNLSRTAGYTDPIRLTWAMETKSTIEIFESAKDFVMEDVTVSLKTDESGKTFLECFKAGKLLKSVPAKYVKDPRIIELKEFTKELTGQRKRVVKALEECMINRDVFKNSEIKNLMLNPVIKPILENLVLKTNDGIGFWKDDSIVDSSGKKLNDNDEILIAHCTDLFASGEWAYYQSYIFDNVLKQPFKQIFRELYVPTQDELESKTISRRYEGYQVSPNKTVALLKTCGWQINYDSGLQRNFYKDKILATVYALADWFTPADVESPTLETVEFYNKKDGLHIEFEKIPPIIFSEIMRDLDLVVSVAHVGDVDPEASHSTIEMRAALVRETVRLFNFENVKINGSHVMITGKLGEYSVHLGSGIAHKILGSSLNIIPVHSQHRGKLFLPFFDDDPKSAEIVSKVILLAEDDKINDPTVLRQIM